MSKFQKPRGTIDYFGDKLVNLVYIEDTLKHLAYVYGYSEIRTPIFEHTEVFTRSVGETSDIVTKEIYHFLDKGGRDIALRPEGTAGVIRAVNENKLLKQQNYPLRLFYSGPIFRYERPQSGRSRQFHQFGFEILNTNNICDDLDIILLIQDTLNKLNLKKYHLNINYIGSLATREKWIEALKIYFAKYKDELSDDSLQRLDKNPLRILDDKVDGNKEFVKKAPQISAFLTQEEKNEFQKILDYLNQAKINYNLDWTLVRGLDYYTGLVFEVVSELEELVGQSTFCGGGRYNNLIKELDGIDAQAIGFAFGLERLLIQYEVENQARLSSSFCQYDLILINLIDDPIQAEMLAHNLRAQNFSTYFEPSIKKLNTGFKLAEKVQARFILIFGKDEAKENKIIVKDQVSMQQEKVEIKSLNTYLDNKLSKE